jgi:hypothetical protein
MREKLCLRQGPAGASCYCRLAQYVWTHLLETKRLKEHVLKHS